MNRFFLIALGAGLLFPTAANAGLSFEEKREICARYWAGQITHQDAASQLSLKEPIHTEIGYLKKGNLQKAVFSFCMVYINGQGD